MRMNGIAALVALILAPGLAAAGVDVVKLPPRIQTLQRPCEELLISREVSFPRLRGSFAELNGQIETHVRLLVDYDAVDARILDGDIECESDRELELDVTSECLATLISPDVVSIRCSTDFGPRVTSSREEDNPSPRGDAPFIRRTDVTIEKHLRGGGQHPLERQSINFIRSGSRFVPVETSAFFPDETAADDFFQLVAVAVLYEMNGSDDGDPYEPIESNLIESIGLTPAGLLVSISDQSFGSWVPEVTIPLERAFHLLEPKLVTLINGVSNHQKHDELR